MKAVHYPRRRNSRNYPVPPGIEPGFNGSIIEDQRDNQILRVMITNINVF
jgi:hypothetical protein